MGAFQDLRTQIGSTITVGGELTAPEDVALRQALIDLIIAAFDPNDDGFLEPSRIQNLSGISKYVGTDSLGGVGVFDLPTFTLTQGEFNNLLTTAGPTLVTVYDGQIPFISTSELEAGTGTVTRRVTPALLKAMIDYHATGSGINSFSTISTPSGTNPVADSSTDTIQLLVDSTHGAGLVSITGDSAADSITFAFNVASLTQETTIDPANDLFLMWDNSANAYRAVKGEDLPGSGSGTLDINGLTQETTFDPTSDELASYDSSATANRKFLYNDVRKWVQESYNTTLTFNRNKTYTAHTQTGAITFSLAGSGNVAGTTILIPITTDGTNTITFPGGATIYGAKDGQPIAAGTYEIYVFYKPDGTVSVSVPGASGSISVAHNTTLTFDHLPLKEAASHTQTGALTYVLAGSGNIAGAGYRLEIVSDGANNITWPTEADYIFGHTSGTPLAAGTYEVYIIYRADGGLTVNVRGAANTTTPIIADPGAGNTAVVAFDSNSGITTFEMNPLNSVGIGLNFTGLSNNQGLMMLFLNTNGTGTIDPSLIQINSGALQVSFLPDFNWTTGFGTPGQRYTMIVEVLSNEAVIAMSPTGAATT